MTQFKVTSGIYKMPGSKFFWYRWTEHGKRYAVSLKTEDEATAIVKKLAIIKDVERRGSSSYRKQAGEPEPQTQMGNVIKKYLEFAKNRDRKPMSPGTAKTVSYELKMFAKELGIESLRDLQPDSMQLWLRSLKKSKSAETLRSYCRDLKAFRRYLVDQHLVRELNELDTPDAPPVGRRNFLEQDVVDKVIDAATDPDLKFILHCGFSAGLRRNEISEARVDWFDLNRGLVHVFSGNGFTTKDRDGRSVPLKKNFKEFLKTYLSGRNPGEYVLEPTKQKGRSRYRFDPNRRVRSHFAKCGVRSSWHDMRRAFASNLVSRGESIYIVSRWLGDLVSVVEKSYGHLGPAAGNVDR